MINEERLFVMLKGIQDRLEHLIYLKELELEDEGIDISGDEEQD